MTSLFVVDFVFELFFKKNLIVISQPQPQRSNGPGKPRASSATRQSHVELSVNQHTGLRTRVLLRCSDYADRNSQ